MGQEEIIKKAVEILDSISTLPTKEIWVLRYKGNILKLRSGKSSWSKKHYAISAFGNEIHHIFHKYKCGLSPTEVTKLLIYTKILSVEKLH